MSRIWVTATMLRKGDSRRYERVSSIIEFPGFYGNLTAVENLDIHRRLMGVPDKKCIEKPLEVVGMLDERNKKVKEFSLGMKQRLGIARALLYQPELLILDEPTNGLDPVGIKEIRQLILRLAQKISITIFISSHILSEVQQLATKIGIIHQGKLINEIDKTILLAKARQCIQIKLDDEKKAVFILEQNLNSSLAGKNYTEASGAGADRYKMAYEYILSKKDDFSLNDGFEVLKKTVQGKAGGLPTQCSMLFDPEKNEVYVILKSDFSKVWKVSIEKGKMETFSGFENPVKLEFDYDGITSGELAKPQKISGTYWEYILLGVIGILVLIGFSISWFFRWRKRAKKFYW